MADEVIPLSLGSWYFTLDVKSPTTITARDFFSRVQSCLDGLAHVDDVAIDLASWPGESADSLSLHPSADARYGEYLGPHANFESVSFSVHLPVEIQAGLLKGVRAVSPDSPVSFRVVMTYGWQMPISCVATLDAPAVDDTSATALAVYRYLVREMAECVGGVRIACVPPIFAHVDVFLHPLEPQGSSAGDFWRVDQSIPAHRRYDIGFSPAPWIDPVRLFLEAVSSELDLYYQLVHHAAGRGHAWEAVDALVRELTELRRKTGLRSGLKRMRSTDRLTNEAIILLTEFAAVERVAAADFRNQSRALFREGGVAYVPELVEDELEDRADYPVEQFSRLVELYQQRRITDRETLVVFATSLLAGSLGAAATLLAGG